MANLMMNNINLGPIIDVYQQLPTSPDYINEHAIYRLYMRKFDIEDGHGKDNENYPVGYYKPAAGSRWTSSTVERGSSGVYMDGYSISPCNKMRRNEVDTSWNPVPCSKSEASGIWYYDYEKNNVYLKWNSVGYGGVNPYTIEMLDKALGTRLDGYYVYTNGDWVKINAEVHEMTAAAEDEDGEHGTTPAPLASASTRVLKNDATWGHEERMIPDDSSFTGSIGRDVVNVGDVIKGYSYVENITACGYTGCSGIVEWVIERVDEYQIKTSEKLMSTNGIIFYRENYMAAGAIGEYGTLTPLSVTAIKNSIRNEDWVNESELFDCRVINDPDSYNIFGDIMMSYVLYRGSDPDNYEHQKFEYNRAALFPINGKNVEGLLTSIGYYYGADNTFLVYQRMIGTIDGVVKASDAATGHYIRKGFAHLSSENMELYDAMLELTWDAWRDERTEGYCTVYLTKEEYDSITPDPDIIYTIID